MMERNQLIRELDRRYLELIVLPTEKCNFRCSYCYEDFLIGRMVKEVREALKLFISRRVPELRQLTLGWFGGEPLLARQVVEELSEHALEECSRHNVVFRSSMTTNAYALDSACFTRMIELGVTHYQVTLDGEADHHDRTRKLANGSCTFERIWSNLGNMQKSGHEFSTTLRVHLTPENLDSVERLVLRIADTFGSDARFSVFFKAVERLGGANDAQMPTLEPNQVESIVPGLQEILAANAMQSASATGRSESDTRVGGSSEPYVCYASRPNSLVIRANERISKCTVMFNDTRNDLGTLRSDGTIQIDNDKAALWMRGFKTMNVEELGCPANGLPEKVITFHRPEMPARVYPA